MAAFQAGCRPSGELTRAKSGNADELMKCLRRFGSVTADIHQIVQKVESHMTTLA
jgi:hypothetical protein